MESNNAGQCMGLRTYSSQTDTMRRTFRSRLTEQRIGRFIISMTFVHILGMPRLTQASLLP